MDLNEVRFVKMSAGKELKMIKGVVDNAYIAVKITTLRRWLKYIIESRKK